ncbi:helix-turn-helix domain-containing protein [Thalassotalea marina]|uniref:helix-turn-helix domain-containing protein n=1 Tax=Thalassotalea marina TaxID=1673741 RepID=UPI0016743C02
MTHSKTKTSLYRRGYVTWLISTGVNTVPAIKEATGMPRRTAQDTLAAIPERLLSLKTKVVNTQLLNGEC